MKKFLPWNAELRVEVSLPRSLTVDFLLRNDSQVLMEYKNYYHTRKTLSLRFLKILLRQVVWTSFNEFFHFEFLKFFCDICLLSALTPLSVFKNRTRNLVLQIVEGFFQNQNLSTSIFCYKAIKTDNWMFLYFLLLFFRH